MLAVGGEQTMNISADLAGSTLPPMPFAVPSRRRHGGATDAA
jgi:hypothetical protein